MLSKEQALTMLKEMDMNDRVLAAIDDESAPVEKVKLKDHEIAKIVNELRDIAVQFHASQQLRERIAQVIVPVLKGEKYEG